MDKSALAEMVVIAEELLLFEFVSALDDVAVAVLLTTVPFGIVDAACTVIVNCALWPLPSSGTVQAMLAPPLHAAAGPVSCVSETKVIPAGSVSLKLGSVAASGPLLLKVMT